MKRSEVPTLELAPGFRISRIIKGGWQLSQGHRADAAEDPVADMAAFAQAGITTFDCADIYTGVEELIGRFRRKWKDELGHTDGIRVLTKFVPDEDALATMDRAYVERIVDRSLRRLGMERLDMVQFSWWNYDIDRYVESALWLKELQQAGKIELLSATNFNSNAIQRMLEAGVRLSTLQVQYSPLDNRPERGLTALCDQYAMKLLCYGTVAGGFLSEKWLGQPEPQPPFTNRSLVKYKLMIDEAGGWEKFQGLLDTLRTIADRHQATITNVVSAYMLSQPAVGALIIGAATTDHLSANLRAFDIRLTEQENRMILELCSGPAGDVFDVERIRTGPHGSIMRYNLNQLAQD